MFVSGNAYGLLCRDYLSYAAHSLVLVNAYVDKCDGYY